MSASPEPGTVELETLEVPLDDDAVQSQAGPRLVSLNSKHADIVFTAQAPVTIGRRFDNTVVFDDQRISQVHCKFYFEGDLLHVHDQSTNGTWVDDVRVGKGNHVPLRGGEEIRLALPPKKTDADMVHYIYRLAPEPPAPEGGITKHYVIGDHVGSGQFGEVKRGRCKATGQEVAIKVINKRKFSLDPNFDDASLLTEAQVMKTINHQHIVRCHDVFNTPDELCIVMELVRDGDLFDLIKKERCFEEGRARRLLWQLIIAVDHLHNVCNIAHRDLKPENILVSARGDKDYILKLTDFGLAKQVTGGGVMSTVCGTPLYLAPEVMAKGPHGKGYTKSVDLWSIGVILFILLSGGLPDASVQETGVRFPEAQFRFITKDAKDLIKQMLTINPTGRITVQGVVAHPWMQLEVPKEYEALSQEIQARANMAPPAPRPPATPPGPAPPQPAAGAASGPVSDLEDKHPTPDTRPVTENGDADTPPPPVNPRKRSFDEATLPHWYWQHNEDADPDTEAAWTAYGAAENERLERNFAVKKAVRLNSTYCVSFEHNIQYRADDPAKQRAVRRGTRGSVLREPAERGPVSREPSK